MTGALEVSAQPPSTTGNGDQAAPAEGAAVKENPDPGTETGGPDGAGE